MAAKAKPFAQCEIVGHDLQNYRENDVMVSSTLVAQRWSTLCSRCAMTAAEVKAETEKRKSKKKEATENAASNDVPSSAT